MVPLLNELPNGCAFAPRCSRADKPVPQRAPPGVEEKLPGHWAALLAASGLTRVRLGFWEPWRPIFAAAVVRIWFDIPDVTHLVALARGIAMSIRRPISR